MRIGERIDVFRTEAFPYVGLVLLTALWALAAAIGMAFGGGRALLASAVVAALFAAAHLRTPAQRERVGLRPIPLPMWAVAAALAASAAFKLAFDTLLLAVLPDGGPDFVGDWARGAGGWTGVIASLVLLGPFVEEVGFRGWIQSRLERRLGPVTAVLAGASIFAASHLSLRAMPSLLATGVVLGYAYLATRSLWMPVLLHISANATAAAMTAGVPFGVRSAVVLLPVAAAALGWLAFHFHAAGRDGVPSHPTAPFPSPGITSA